MLDLKEILKKKYPQLKKEKQIPIKRGKYNRVLVIRLEEETYQEAKNIVSGLTSLNLSNFARHGLKLAINEHKEQTARLNEQYSKLNGRNNG